MAAVDEEGTPPEAVSQLRGALEKLEEEHRKLRSGLRRGESGAWVYVYAQNS